MNDLLSGPWALDRNWATRAYRSMSDPTPREAAAQPDPVREGATIIIPLHGMMTAKGSWWSTSTDAFTDLIRASGDNAKIGAIVLDINSPGGSTYGVEEAAEAVFALRQVKPVIAVANHLACSAAWHVATQASAVYASPSADVGSLGVYSMHVDESKYLEDIGVKVSLISAGPKKVAGNPFEPLSDQARADIQADVDASYQTFLANVARGRGISADEVKAKHGEGASVMAATAHANGMIDGIMTLRDAIAKVSSSRSRLALMRRRAQALEALYE